MKSIFAYITISVLIHVGLFYYLFFAHREESLEPVSNEIIIERNSTSTQNMKKGNDSKNVVTNQETPPKNENLILQPLEGSSDQSSSATLGNSENIVDTLLKSNPTPIYPHVSRLKNEEGRVVLKIKLKDDGSLDIKIDRSSGFKNLDYAAIDSVKTWKIPAELQEKLKTKEVEVPFLFKLHD